MTTRSLRPILALLSIALLGTACEVSTRETQEDQPAACQGSTEGITGPSGLGAGDSATGGTDVAQSFVAPDGSARINGVTLRLQAVSSGAGKLGGNLEVTV